jgi:hypothetical protein
MFKFFTVNSDSTVDSIKKQYKKLAFQYHPDVGGDVETMKAINIEYEQALKELGKMNNKNYGVDSEFINIIDSLIKLKMKNVEIEICGWFVYVTGNTKPYKDALKSLKLWFNSQKSAWYYKPSWYRKKDKKVWSMEEIRTVFGSQIVNNGRREDDLAITAG